MYINHKLYLLWKEWKSSQKFLFKVVKASRKNVSESVYNVPSSHVGMMIESMAGKSASLHGLCHDATPFTFSEEDPAIDYFGQMLTRGNILLYTIIEFWCLLVTLKTLSGIGWLRLQAEKSTNTWQCLLGHKLTEIKKLLLLNKIIRNSSQRLKLS